MHSWWVAEFNKGVRVGPGSYRVSLLPVYRRLELTALCSCFVYCSFHTATHRMKVPCFQSKCLERPAFSGKQNIRKDGFTPCAYSLSGPSSLTSFPAQLHLLLSFVGRQKCLQPNTLLLKSFCRPPGISYGPPASERGSWWLAT